MDQTCEQGFPEKGFAKLELYIQVTLDHNVNHFWPRSSTPGTPNSDSKLAFDTKNI